MDNTDESLWKALGLSADDFIEPLPDDVWDAAIAHAVDPNTPQIDPEIVPALDDPNLTDASADEVSLHDPDDSLAPDHHLGADDQLDVGEDWDTGGDIDLGDDPSTDGY